MTTTATSKRLAALKHGLEVDKALLQKSKAINIPEPLASDSPKAPLNTALFAAILAGLGGLLVGIAIGTTYIAPTL